MNRLQRELDRLTYDIARSFILERYPAECNDFDVVWDQFLTWRKAQAEAFEDTTFVDGLDFADIRDASFASHAAIFTLQMVLVEMSKTDVVPTTLEEVKENIRQAVRGFRGSEVFADEIAHSKGEVVFHALEHLWQHQKTMLEAAAVSVDESSDAGSRHGKTKRALVDWRTAVSWMDVKPKIYVEWVDEDGNSGEGWEDHEGAIVKLSNQSYDFAIIEVPRGFGTLFILAGERAELRKPIQELVNQKPGVVFALGLYHSGEFIDVPTIAKAMDVDALLPVIRGRLAHFAKAYGAYIRSRLIQWRAQRARFECQPVPTAYCWIRSEEDRKSSELAAALWLIES